MPDYVYRSFTKPPEFAGPKREFMILTKAEADDMGILYVTPWYIGESGDWVLTDDEYVMEVVRKNPFGEVGSYEIHFTGAKKIVDPRFISGIELSWSAYRDYPQNRVQYSSHTPRSRIEIFVRTRNCQRAFDFYVNLWLLRKGKLTSKDLTEFGRMASPGDFKPNARAKWLLKKRIVQDILMKKLAESLGDMNITFDNVVVTVQDAIQLARANKNAKHMLDGADFLYKLVSAAAYAEESGNRNDDDADDWSFADAIEAGEDQKQLPEDIGQVEFKDYSDLDVYENRSNPVFGVDIEDDEE